MNFKSIKTRNLIIGATSVIAVFYAISMWRTQTMKIEESLLMMIITQVLFFVLFGLIIMLIFWYTKKN